MSPQPNPYLSLVDRREDQPKLRIAFVGAALAGAKKIFRRKDENVTAEHYVAIRDFIEASPGERFECAVVDLRTAQDTNALWLASIAAKRQIKRVIVLAAPYDEEKFNAIPGIHKVLPAPVTPQAIMQALFEASQEVDAEADERERNLAEERALAEIVFAKERAQKAEKEKVAAKAEAAKAAPQDLTPIPDEPGKEKLDTEAAKASDAAEAKGDFETSIAKRRRAEKERRSLWNYFLPVANYVYKKLAVVVLGSLFFAFLFYGAMIVFFLTSSQWSLPFELSRGHELVARTERDLSQMLVRRNEVQQKLEQAEADLAVAERDALDAELNLTVINQSIGVEITQQQALLKQVEAHAGDISALIAEFEAQDRSGGLTREIDGAYRKRTITRKTRDANTLAVMEARQRMAALSNELALQRIEKDKINTRIAFLKSLQAEMDRPEILSLLAPDAELTVMAREVINQRNTIARSQRAVEIARLDAQHLRDSASIVGKNIASIEATPLAKALTAPVGVLFVPYDNIENFKPGKPLYSCALSIIFCRKVGETGASISGETTSVHPLFGKPLRGVFVEANVENQNDIKQELLHVGRPPLFF